MAKVLLVAWAQLFLAILVLGGVWLGLPARWLWVDLPGTLLGAGCLIASAALLRRTTWSLRFARGVLWVELVTGTLCATLLGISAAQLAGSYGPVGAGGAVLLATIALLVFPYLVVFPALQLGWLRSLG